MWILLFRRTPVKIKESKRIDKYLNYFRELRKKTNMTIDGDTNCCWCTWNSSPTAWNEDWRKWRDDEVFLRSARIIRRILKTWGDLLIRIQWKPPITIIRVGRFINLYFGIGFFFFLDTAVFSSVFRVLISSFCFLRRPFIFLRNDDISSR